MITAILNDCSMYPDVREALMRLSNVVPISGSICFKNPVGKGSSRQVKFLEELIKEQNLFYLMGMKESRHIDS